MKKSNLSGLLLLCASLLLLAGCKGKNEPTNKDLAEGESAKVTFELSLPQGESFTYRSAIHDAPEWKVENLTLYTFSGDGSKLLAIDHITSSDLHPNGEAKYTYTKDIAKDKVGVYQFAFVANDQIANATIGTTSLKDFGELHMTKQLPAMGTSKHLLNDNNIPMTGMAEQNGSHKIAVTGTTKGVSVTLTRVVARIDISNHIPNLTITKLSLENTFDQTTVFHSINYRTIFGHGGIAKVTMREGFAPLPNPFKGIAGVDGKQLKKAFYLYEGPQPAEVAKRGEATTIVVEGTLDNGKNIVYKIPFIRHSKAYDPIDVKRNHLYRLVLGDNKPVEPESKVVFTIEDTPWNAVILNHEMEFDKLTLVSAPTFSPTRVTIPDRNKDVWWYNAAQQTFYTSADGIKLIFAFRSSREIDKNFNFRCNQIYSRIETNYIINEIKDHPLCDELTHVFTIDILPFIRMGKSPKNEAIFEIYSERIISDPNYKEDPEKAKFILRIITDRIYRNKNVSPAV